MTKKITQPTEIDPVISYVLVRTDAPDFQWGKACAQAHHCGTQMTEELDSSDVSLAEMYKEWQEDRTFGTVLTLGVTASEMRQAVSLARLLGIHSAVVHDPTYPIRDGDQYLTIPVDTCAYVFGRKSQCAPVVGAFELLHERMVS